MLNFWTFYGSVIKVVIFLSGIFYFFRLNEIFFMVEVYIFCFFFRGLVSIFFVCFLFVVEGINGFRFVFFFVFRRFVM